MSDTTESVVVGFDGSPDAVRTLRWAVTFARANELSVRVVVARGDLFSVSAWADDWTRGLAQEWCDQARDVLGELGAGPVDVVTVDGQPSAALTEESRRAIVVVVGSRGHGALAGAAQGSVSQHVSRHAACPVVVVRAAHDDLSRRVVVGVDGSACSLQALEFALGFAAANNGGVEVVYAPERWRGQAYQGPAELLPEIMAEFEAHERAVVRDIEAVTARFPDLAVHVERISGRAARALVDASQAAALVVVGSRGRGAFAGLVLGSVSAEVLHHAHCPVAVVR
jgi:nucleotide-binding universal stress UspA family protein